MVLITQQNLLTISLRKNMSFFGTPGKDFGVGRDLIKEEMYHYEVRI